LTLEHAEAVPYREYPAAARPVLGVRYCTVCGISGELSDRYEHNYLLWSDEPFSPAVVTREMTALGFQVSSVFRTLDTQQPWAARITGGPELPAESYVGRFHGDWSAVRWIGLWLRHRGYVVHDQPDHGWRAVAAAQALYDQRNLYELPSDAVVLLTGQQATGLAILAGRRIPTASELAAALRAQEHSRWSSEQLWQRFYDHRVALFAADVRRVRAEGARLAGAPPDRQQVAGRQERQRAVARIPALRVRVGESFPLLRFLVGSFEDRRPDGYASYTTLCNRLDIVTGDGETVGLTLELMVRGGLLVHPGAVTPYCPPEADYADDPELALAQAGQQWPDPLWCAVFPVSPARFEMWGWPATPTTVRRNLSIAVTFPGGQEFVAVPAWSDTFHLWDYFTADGPLPAQEEGHEIFVPDDLNLMKTVQARIVEWSGGEDPGQGGGDR
jgi:hypothetical protein